jgi:hypothetical protein
VDFLTTAIIHSAMSTATGLIQRSTETVDLTGDLTRHILYRPTSVIVEIRASCERDCADDGVEVGFGSVEPFQSEAAFVFGKCLSILRLAYRYCDRSCWIVEAIHS